MTRGTGEASGAPAPCGGLRSVVWATLLTAALVVAGAAWFVPSSFATAASALRAAGTPQPGTHPPRDPFKPLVGQPNQANQANQADQADQQVPGASLAPVPTAPPQAGPAQPSSPPRRQRTGGHPTPAEPKSARPALAVAPQASRHVVGSGETLWQIAVASSAPGSSVAVLAARANAIYAANEAVIGRDPSQLLSGTVLVLPQSGYAG
jgi:hypothetical protein